MEKESPPTLFGKHYDYKQIEHVCSAFFDTAYGLRDVADTVRWLSQRRAAERNTPEFARVVRWYRRRCRLDWMPDLEHVGRRISDARSVIERLRPALYVAEHGPIFLPFRHIQNHARTIFDRVLDRLDEIVEPLKASLPAEWEPANYEDWDALKPRARCAKMLPMYLAATQTSHNPVITTDTQMHVDEMWKVAQIAHRLMEALGQAHQPWLDGSLLLADMGYLACASVDFGGQIDDSYPVADRFPRDFIEPDDWRRYASLLQRFKAIAPLAGVTDLDVSDALCAAEELALAHHEFATGQCDRATVDRAGAHFDRVKFNQAYWRIRRAIGDRLRSLILDRGQMWAEAFGRWASDVSTQDAAMLKGVLPAAVDQKPQASELPSLVLPANGDLLGLLKALGEHQRSVDAFVNTFEPGQAPDDLLDQQSNTPLEYAAKWLGERTDLRRETWREVAIRVAINIGFGPSNSQTQGTFPDAQHLAPKVGEWNNPAITVQLKAALAEKWLALKSGSALAAGDVGRIKTGAPITGAKTNGKPKRRGRPADTDAQADAKLAEAWDTGHYQTYDQLGQEKGMSGRDVELAIDRHRKRRRRQKPSE